MNIIARNNNFTLVHTEGNESFEDRQMTQPGHYVAVICNNIDQYGQVNRVVCDLKYLGEGTEDQIERFITSHKMLHEQDIKDVVNGYYEITTIYSDAVTQSH